MVDAIVRRNIKKEQEYKDFIFCDADNATLQVMLNEINMLGYDFNYLAELEAYRIPGAGDIVTKHIDLFVDEATRAYLLHHIVSDKVPDCDSIILSLYLHFKASNSYVSSTHYSAPAHICARYDNAFKLLKPKRIKTELVKLARNPRDVFYLPFTMRMLASWKIPEMNNIFINLLDDSQVTMHDLGMSEDDDRFHFSSYMYIKQQLKFIAIDGLKYYPTSGTLEVLRNQLNSSDKDIVNAAKKVIVKLQSR